MRRLLALILLLAAASPSSSLVVERPEIRATAGGLQTSAAYFTVKNTGKTADVLTGAACACAATAAVHETKAVGGVSRMLPTGPLTLAPGGQLTLRPGGLHLMLTGLKAPIKAGETVRVTLVFAKAGKRDIAFKASVTPGIAAAENGMAEMHH